MAEPVAPGNGPGNERHVLAKRKCGDAAHCTVDVAAHSEACAGMVDVARPRIVRIGIEEALQVRALPAPYPGRARAAQGSLRRVAAIPPLVFAAPFIIMRNSVRARRIERRRAYMVMVATLIAGL
jgi:hypothetical protein